MGFHQQAWIAAAGAAATAAVVRLAQRGVLHRGAVSVAACGIKLADVVRAETQSIIDDASDVTAEARRRARINAAVKERLAKEEGRIREEVTAEIDKAGVDA